MDFWRFANVAAVEDMTVLVPVYDHGIGWTAGLLGMIAGIALFPALAHIASAGSARARRIWAAGGALTVSIGLWGALHLAVLGFRLPVGFTFDFMMSLLAISPGFLGCLAALVILGREPRKMPALCGAALALTLGIAGTHYTLLEALRGNLEFAYDPLLVVHSLVLPYCAAFLACFVNRQTSSEQPPWPRWVAGSFLIGIALLANHFAAMGGTTFFAVGDPLALAVTTAPGFLAPIIGGAALVVLCAFFIGSVVDSRLSEATAAVHRSEARNRSVIENLLDAHLITDAGSIVRSFNPAAERMFGWAAQDIIGRPVTLLMGDSATGRLSDCPRPAQRPTEIARAVHGAISPDTARRRSGEAFPIELQISPFQVDGEQFYSCSVRDLTQTWAAERKTRRLAAAIEQSGDAVVILDTEHRIQYVNPQYERQTGYSQVEVVGSVPTGGASGAGRYDEIWATVATGRNWTGTVRSKRRDGSTRDEELTVSPVIEESGEISAYVAIFRDVTRRLEEEQERRRLAEALHHCADSIEMLDSHGRLLYMNAACEQRTGFRLDDVRGCRPEALMDFTPAGAAYGEMVQTVVRQGQPWSGTLKSLSQDGQIREEDVTVSPMRDSAGTVNAYVVVKRDTTVRRRLEEQTRQRQKLDSLSQLADGIARELSTPMEQLRDNLRFLRDSFAHLDRLLLELGNLASTQAPIRPAALAGCLQSADVDFLRREIKDAVGQSEDSGQQLAGIVHAMRDLAQSTPQAISLDLNRAIQSALTVTASDWKPVAEVRTTFDPQLQPLLCVPGEFSMVMMNLIMMAAQAVAAVSKSGLRGKGSIGIVTRALPGCTEIRLTHTGRAPDRESSLALLGSQSSQPGDRQGLALAHEIMVRRHGGTLEIEHEPGEGPVFVIRIPSRVDAQTLTASAA